MSLGDTAFSLWNAGFDACGYPKSIHKTEKEKPMTDTIPTPDKLLAALIERLTDNLGWAERYEIEFSQVAKDDLKQVLVHLEALPPQSAAKPVADGWKNAFEQEAAKFQRETLRTSELTQTLQKLVDIHRQDHTKGPWSRGCWRCEATAEAEELLAKPLPTLTQPVDDGCKLVPVEQVEQRIAYLLKPAEAEASVLTMWNEKEYPNSPQKPVPIEQTQAYATAEMLKALSASPASSGGERRAVLEKLKQAIDECKDDTWECPQCGHSEPWWTGCNAHYSSEYPTSPRAALAAISEPDGRG